MVVNVVVTAFWGLLLLSVLVFIHEGGHYLAARAFGVRVTEFFLGLPCRWRLSHKSRSHGTEIGVTPVLLGGYTRICGMEGTAEDHLAEALACVQRHGRVSVEELASEVGVSVDDAYGLLARLADWGSIRPCYDASLGEREGQRDWPRSFETLRRDANLLTEYDKGHDFSAAGTTDYGEPRPVEGAPEAFLSSERGRTYLGCGFWKRFCMLCAGPLVNVLFALLLVVGMLSVVGTEVGLNSNVIGEVQEGSLAAQAGIESGDQITAVDGTEVTDWNTLHDALQDPLSEGRDFTLTYVRDGQTAQARVSLGGQSQSMLGIRAQTTTYRMGLADATRYAFSYAGMVGQYAVRLIMPQHTMQVLDSSTSIVGISAMASEAVSTGPSEVIELLAAVSMSLGFMNLLPIPPLDGGKILLEIIEAIRRKPLSARATNYISYAGIAFFCFVFVVVLRNDIFRFVIG